VYAGADETALLTLALGDGDTSVPPIVLGGVRRLPTLVRLPDDWFGWVPLTAYWYLWELFRGGGGRSKLDKLGAFGLLVEKADPPISDPECIWVGAATAAATVTVVYWKRPGGRWY
jgi:hypothetical protein